MNCVCLYNSAIMAENVRPTVTSVFDIVGRQDSMESAGSCVANRTTLARRVTGPTLLWNKGLSVYPSQTLALSWYQAAVKSAVLARTQSVALRQRQVNQIRLNSFFMLSTVHHVAE